MTHTLQTNVADVVLPIPGGPDNNTALNVDPSSLPYKEADVYHVTMTFIDNTSTFPPILYFLVWSNSMIVKPFSQPSG